jgi:hypothetical protein
MENEEADIAALSSVEAECMARQVPFYSPTNQLGAVRSISSISE